MGDRFAVATSEHVILKPYIKMLFGGMDVMVYTVGVIIIAIVYFIWCHVSNSSVLSQLLLQRCSRAKLLL